MTDSEPFKTVEEVAAFLGVSERTVRRHCSTEVRDRIPFYRPTGELRFRLSEVSAWAERTRNDPTRRRGRRPRLPLDKGEPTGYPVPRFGQPGAASEDVDGKEVA